MLTRKRFFRRHIMAAAIASLALLVPGLSSATSTDLTELNLEELLNVEVTSAARQPQGIYETAAAIFVITQEDIRQSGATSIPDVLRMVPGVQVAQINSSAYAISARGLNSRFANKLLVLQDGRTLYNQSFSGVYWNAQDTVLSDIDRIEVIRGAGAALWGANAVNGVINIITKPAAETQGTHLTVTAGNEDLYIVEARQGVQINDQGYLRLFAKGFERDGGSTPDGDDESDDWRIIRAGFRYDQDAALQNHLTLQGDIYHGFAGETFTAATLQPPFTTTSTDDNEIFGGNLLGRWQRTFSSTSDLSLQAYYDKARNWEEIAGQDRQTIDIDFQHRFAPTKNQQIVWGLGYRHYWDHTKRGQIISFNPQDEQTDLFTAFINDQVTLIPDKLKLITGTQIEHNDFSGSEIQPTLRLLWTPRPFYSIWSSVSRSVRTPSRAETAIDLRQNVVPIAMLPPPLNGLPGPPLGQFSLIGDDDFDAETSWTYELGMRCQPRADLHLELVVFHSTYEDLLSADLATPVLETDNWLLPLVANNRLDAKTYGVEASADWVIRNWWKVQTAYTYLNVLPSLESDGVYTGFKESVNNSPHHQLSIQSKFNVARDWEWDLWLRLVDNLPASDIGGYGALDMRLAWKPRPGLLLELIGKNLLDPQHPEFESDALMATVVEIDRSLMARISWDF